MADYPSQWEADVVLRDGGTVHLRPIRPDDADRLRDMFGRLSPETIYKRFFMARTALSAGDVDRFTRVDHVNRVALIALLGGAMVAVGRYERIDDIRAEVAFAVEDAHQGRGLGSVLLEHLAAAAAERGLRGFVAEVLPGNHRMVSVFTDAGYRAETRYADGVVHLSFPIEATAASIRVRQAREHRAEARSIERLLNPRSVAVVGASSAERGVGRALLSHLLAAGFRGPVYPVHPRAPRLAGLPAWPAVDAVPGAVDLAVIAVPADAVPGVVRACVRKGVHALVVLSGGFADLGPAGVLAQRELVATARAGGMRVIGPNCLGVLNTAPEVSLNATLAPVFPGPGRVGFFCQSGALGIAILESVARRGLGLSTFVSAGNRADVSGNDLLQFWEDDPRTDVVLLYLESFGNPRKFGRLARRLARRKPVVAVRSGRSQVGPPAGHVGTVEVVPEEAVDALFAQAGVIRVRNLAAMFDVAQLLAYQPLPAGRRLALIGNSAALAVLAADAAVGLGLTVSRRTDLGVAAGADDFAGALAGALDADDVDAVISVFVPPLPVPDDEVGRVLAAGAARAAKPVLSTFLAFEGVPQALTRPAPDGVPGRGSVPSYRSPDTAVAALAAVVDYAEWRRRPAGSVPGLDRVDPAGAARFIDQRLGAAGVSAELGADDVAGLLAAYGIDVWPALAVDDADRAVLAAERLGYPVVLKPADPRFRHRADLGVVRLDLADGVQVRAGWAAIRRAVGADAGPVLVQRLAPPGVATEVTVREDPSFGALVGFAIGGVASDLLGDRAYRAAPLTDVDAGRLVRAPRAAPLLFGYRGATTADVAALEDLLLRVGRLADEHPQVASLTLNPVLVAPAGAGVAVLGANCRLASAPSPTDSGPRRLR